MRGGLILNVSKIRVKWFTSFQLGRPKKKKKSLSPFKGLNSSLVPFTGRQSVPSVITIGSTVQEKKIISVSSMYVRYVIIICPWF